MKIFKMFLAIEIIALAAVSFIICSKVIDYVIGYDIDWNEFLSTLLMTFIVFNYLIVIIIAIKWAFKNLID